MQSMEIFSTSPNIPKRPGYIRLSMLTMIAFGTVFFPRVLQLLKFPSIVNIAHLGLVPALFVFVLVKTRIRDRTQIAIVQELLVALLIFFGVSVASALLNQAGAINVFVNFLLLCEHFLFIIIIICLPLSPDKLKAFRAFIIASSFINTLFAYVQQYVFRLHLHQGLQDNIKGVFINQGAGHVIGASIALTFGVYYFFAAKKFPILFRAAIFLAMFWHMKLADAKQAILAFGIAGILLVFSKFKDIVEAIKFLTILVVLGYAFWWTIQNVPGFGAFKTWMRPDIYGPQGAATLLKLATFTIVPTFYESPLHPWLGLGPGHTVGRLGGWMLREYASLLGPLGATSHPASSAVWQAVGANWLGDQSSMFSPLFGWAGIWGDLGWLGLASFLYIWSVVWRRLCFDDVSKFLMLCPLVFGLIFSQMEEPGYMIYVGSIIALRWQEYHSQKKFPEQFADNAASKKLPRSPKALFQTLLLLR